MWQRLLHCLRTIYYEIEDDDEDEMATEIGQDDPELDSETEEEDEPSTIQQELASDYIDLSSDSDEVGSDVSSDGIESTNAYLRHRRRRHRNHIILSSDGIS